MVRTIYLPDGESWTVLGSDDAEPSLRRIIQRYLGDDCIELLDDVVAQVENKPCEDCPYG